MNESDGLNIHRSAANFLWNSLFEQYVHISTTGLKISDLLPKKKQFYVTNVSLV